MNEEIVQGIGILKKEVYAGLRPIKLQNYILWREDVYSIIMKDVVNQMSPKYTCLRPPGAAGAAILTDGGYLVFGDVSPANGSKTCKELGECLMEDGHCVRTIHAEVRAVLNAGSMGLSCEHGVMFSILKPCFQCTKVIIAAGIDTVVYSGVAYDEPRTTEISENAQLRYINIDVGLAYGQAMVIMQGGSDEDI